MKKRFYDNSEYYYIDGSKLNIDECYSQHKSTRYVNYYLRTEKSAECRIPELYKEIWQCCGCTACESICPVGAIRMEPDEEGFLYPVINLAECISCYRCEKVCVFK